MSNKNRFLYMKIYNEFKKNIENKSWEQGMKLPTEHELVLKYQVSRHTIRKAFDKLEQDEYINRIAGRGTFVSRKSRYKLTSLESFSEQMLSIGSEPSSRIISTNLEIPSDLASSHLKLKKGEKAFIIKRLRLADELPMCYEVAYISRSLCPDIDLLMGEKTSLYELYEKHYNLNLTYGEIFLEAETCPSEILKLLEIPKKSPVLKMQCVVYVDNKIPLYYVESFYAGDKYMFFASMPRNYN